MEAFKPDLTQQEREMGALKVVALAGAVLIGTLIGVELAEQPADCAMRTGDITFDVNPFACAEDIGIPTPWDL